MRNDAARVGAMVVLVGVLWGCGDGSGQAAAPEASDTSALAHVGAPVPGGDIHIVRLVSQGDRYAFEPARIRARPGDVIRFVHTGYQPESVAFDTVRAPAGAADFLRRQRADAGILLTRPGQIFELSLEGAPPGEYPFASVPHGAAGMEGTLAVDAPP